MKAAIIKTTGREGSSEVPGWLVPGTDDLFAIDLREDACLDAIPPIPAYYVITHVPTGFKINRAPYTDAGTRYAAAAVATRFYAEYKKRGWTLNTDDPAIVTAPFKDLSDDEKRKFWEAVADWDTAEKPAEGKTGDL